MYQVLKDFAAPIATIIAACTAAYFVRRQAKTAESQAKTALDQLRFNLFQKRYAIYLDVRALIRLIAVGANREDFDVWAVAPHFSVMEEARFFYSDRICHWIEGLKEECQSYLQVKTLDRSDPIQEAEKLRLLMGRWQAMPKFFEPELEFRQLTLRKPDR